MAYPSSSKNLVTAEKLAAVIGGDDGTGGLWGKTKALVAALDGTITGTAGAGKTLTALSQTDGKVTATFGDISITKSQVSDFPTIPTVNNGTLTIKQNGTSAGTFTANQSGNSTIELTDTTYESKTAASGGTDVSLVTTGEKYTWNNKSNLALGETSTTAYRGDRGKTAYDHSQSTHAPTTSASEASGGTTLSLVTTGEKYTWNHKANTASPTFTGTPIAPTAAAGTNTQQIATTAFVKTAVENGLATADALTYKGTVDGGSTSGYGALTPAASKGDVYKVATAGKIDGVAVEVGDMLICNTDETAAATSSNYATIAASWDFIQGNTEGVVVGPASAVDTHVAAFDGTTGKLIKDSGFTIAKSVPSDAKFTDTDTKVTSAANHYSPSTASGSDKSASASGATAAWGIDVVKGVTLNTDGKGHVTGISVTSGKIPASSGITVTTSSVSDGTNTFNKYIHPTTSGNKHIPSGGSSGQFLGWSADGTAAWVSNPNSDTKVTQTLVASDNTSAYPILLAPTGQTATATTTSNFVTGAKYTPSTNTLTVNVSGNAATASKINTSAKIGDTNKGVYIAADGTVTAMSYTVSKSVPSNAVFTDTDTKVTSVDNHYTPAEDSTAEKDASGGGAAQLPTSGTGTLVQVVTGVKMDAKGHVTGVVSKGLWSPDNNTTYTPQTLGSGYGTCGTAAATAAKAVTLSGYEIVTNGIVAVKFTYAVPASATLNINSKGAKNIYYRGAVITAGVIGAGDTATFVYDGTQYQLLSIDSGEQEMTDTEVTDLLAALT